MQEVVNCSVAQDNKELLIAGGPPKEHVALFDEAQRAWDLQQTANFMKRKKKRPDFNQSEPEFLISCLDRHPDWAVIVCLVGGGQEINTGEAGISEWIDSLLRKFPGWDVYISPRLTDSEYGAGSVIAKLKETPLKVEYKDELHLAVSLRSFRAERVSELVKKVLDLEAASHIRPGSRINRIAVLRDPASAIFAEKSPPALRPGRAA